MESEKKMSMKDFILQKKLQMKNTRNKETQMDQLNSYIETAQIQSFQTHFNNLHQDQITSYLFSEDLMKVTPLMKMISSQKAAQFMNIINLHVGEEFNLINQKVCLKWYSNEFLENEWKNKFSALNRFIVKNILQIENQQARQNLASKIVQYCSIQRNFVFELYLNFLNFHMVKDHMPPIKNSEIIQETLAILDLFYIPLSEALSQGGEFQLLHDLIDLKQSNIKQKIWNSGDFVSACKNNLLNQYNFQLKELKVNFLHQLFLQENVKYILEITKLISDSQNSSYNKLLYTAFSSFNSNKLLPIDIGLRKWSYSNIQKLLGLVKSYPQIIRFSTNSLNQVILNHQLNQQEIQGLIFEILSNNFNSKGYVDSVKIEKRVNLRQQNSAFDMYFPEFQISSIVTYNVDSVISKKDGESYPLLNYLDRFRQKSSLKILQKLFITPLLSRKSVKLMIVSTIKSFYKKEQLNINMNSEGQNNLKQISTYHSLLLRLLSNIKPSECSQYLLSKTFINFPYLLFIQQNKKIRIQLSKHFLVQYLQNCPCLQENSQNKMIIQTIFGSKDSEKFIGKNYNMYVQILKGLNKSSVFKNLKNQSFLKTQIRSHLLLYFEKMTPQELFNSNYIKELSLYFFNLKLQKNKFSKKSKYELQSDWGLYKGPQLCKKLSSVPLKKYLQHQQQVQLAQQGQNILEKQKIEYNVSNGSKLVKVIVNFLQGNQNVDQIDEEKQAYSDVNISGKKVDWFRTKYQKFKSINSLKRYLQKLSQELSEENNNSVKLKKQIQLSIFNQNLQEEIELILKSGFDFYFKKADVQKIYQDQQNPSSTNPQPKRKEIKNQTLRNVVQRMLRNQSSFITAILYCEENDVNEFSYYFKKSEMQVMMGKAMQVFSTRNISRPMKKPFYKYPFEPLDPIPFHVFLHIQQIVKSTQNSNYTQSVSNQKLFKNFILNLQNKLMYLSQLDNLKLSKKAAIQQIKDKSMKELINFWNKGHRIIKQKFKYEENVRKLIENVIVKNKQSKNADGKNMQQKLPSQDLKQNLKEYYCLIGQKFFKKYQNNGMDLGQILRGLSTNQIFLMDAYIQNHQTSNILFVYKLQAEQNPFKCFKQRVSIQSPLRALVGKKTHSQIGSIFVNQLKRFSLQQFQQVFKQIEKLNFINISDIFHQLSQEDKLIWLLEYVLTSQNQSQNYQKKITPNYLTGLPKQNMPNLTIFVVLWVQNTCFRFWLNEITQNGSQDVEYYNLTFYSKCSMRTFDVVLRQIEKYFKKGNPIFKEDKVVSKSKEIIQSLVNSLEWSKVQKLISLKGLDYIEHIVSAAFTCIGNNISTAKTMLKTQQEKKQFERIICKLFDLIKTSKASLDQKQFINAFKCDSQKAFQCIKPKKLTIEAFVDCLKYKPQEAKLFLPIQIDINQQKIPSGKYFKANFPLTPYYYEKFGNSKWMLDLLRIQRKLLAAGNQLKRLDKTMESLILLDKMENNFDQFYSEQQKNLKCQKILHSNTIKSIKKYPKQWFDNYLKTNKIKNLQVLTQQLLIELIDLSYIKKDNIIQVISTCKLDVIKHFLKKTGLKFNYKLIKQIEQTHLKGEKYQDNFWNFIIKIQNEPFIVQFIQAFNLLQICPVQSYDNALLTNIALYRRIQLLAYVIKYFQTKSARKLEFVFNKEGKIQGYLFTLPEQVSVTMNFYQYYFLVKSSKNQCPPFYTSSRFLIETENQQKLIDKLSFVPQLKKRLEILHILSSFVHLNKNLNFKKDVLMKNLLSLNHQKQQQHSVIQDSGRLKWQNFLTYLVQPSIQLFQKKHFGIMIEVLAVYKANEKIGINVKDLQRIYPTEINIIKSVDKYIDKSLDLMEFTKEIIQKCAELKAIVLMNNLQFFMQNFDFDFQDNQKPEDSVIYAKGILLNLKHFQQNNKYKQILQKFLQCCFAWKGQSYFDKSYSVFLKKNVLQYLLVSYSQGNSFSLKILNELLKLNKQKIGELFFLCATKINEVNFKGEFQPSFDMRTWNNIIEECLSVKFALSQIKDEKKIQTFLIESEKALRTMLKQKKSLNIQNTNDIINQAIKKMQSSRKEQILAYISILINQAYILCSLHEFQTEIKQSIEQKQNLQIDIMLSEKEFNVKVKQQNHFSFVIPYTWIHTQTGIYLLSIDIPEILKKSERQIELYRLKKHSQVSQLKDKFSINSESNFSNLSFVIDVQSFEKVEKSESLKKLVQYLPLQNNGIYMIEKTLEYVDQRLFNDKTIPYYSFSDVYGPVKINDQNLIAQKIINCLNFYELIRLPNQTVIIQYVKQQSSQDKEGLICFEDFFKYVKYIQNEVTDNHPLNKAQFYKFSNKIQLHIDEDTQQVTVNTDKFSLFNILKILLLVNQKSNEIRNLFQNRIDLRFNSKSILNLYNQILTNNNKDKGSAFQFINNFLKNQSNKDLIVKIVLMILDDAMNIMKVLKGTVVSYEIVKKPQKTHKIYKIYDFIYLNRIGYFIEDQIFTIKLEVFISKGQSLESSQLQKSDIVSRKHFLQSIFSSSQFLTDYFLQKSDLNTQCVKVSRSVSAKLNKTVNLHINYKSLYKFVDHFKNEVSIKEIDGYLKSLKIYLIGNIEKKLMQYSVSQHVVDSHQTMLLNTFEYLQRSLRKSNLNLALMESEVSKIYHQTQLKYNLNQLNLNEGLEILEGYSQQISNFGDSAKNVFLIQIFKSYFTTLVSEGMKFVVGFKTKNKNPILINFVKRQDIDKINLVDVSYLLMLTTSIPTNDELNRSKIIRMFVSDLNKNIYRVSDRIKDYLLSLPEQNHQIRNITELVPVIQSNFVIDFFDSEFVQQNSKVKQNKNIKTFQLNLTKQPKFKLIPTRIQPISIRNHLKKNPILCKQVKIFVENINKVWGETHLDLILDSSKLSNNIALEKIVQIIKLSLFDIESAIVEFLSQSCRNAELQVYCSIYQCRNVRQNVILQLRKQIFARYLKTIRLIVSDTNQPSLKIEDTQLVLEVSYTADYKFVKGKDILLKILEFIVVKQLQSNKNKLKLQNLNPKCIQSLLSYTKLFDILIVSKFQSQEIQKVIQIINKSNVLKNDSQKEYRPFIKISENNKEGVFCEPKQKCISIGMNISSSQIVFYTCSDILNAILNNFKQDWDLLKLKTEFNAKDSMIYVQGDFGQQCMLVIENRQNLLVSKEKIIKSDTKKGNINIAQIVKKLSLISSVRYWIIDFSNNQCSQNYIYTLPQEGTTNVINKKLSSVFTNESISVFVKDQQLLDMNKLPVKISIQQPNQQGSCAYLTVLKDQFKNMFSISMKSKQVAELRFIFKSSGNVSLNLGCYKNIMDPNILQCYQLIVSSNKSVVIQNTRFIELHFRNKVHQSQQVKSKEKKAKIHQKVFTQPAEKALVEDQEDKTIKIENIQSQVYVVNNESKTYLTRAGEQRIDYIQMCDGDYNPVQYHGELNIQFKHINNLCKIVPRIDKKGLKIGLIWTPTIRGHYKVFFNGICLNPEYQIGVCSAVADPTVSIIEKPKISKICFVQETQVTFNLKDSYRNIYTELQESILEDGLLIGIKVVNNQQIQKYLKIKQQPINKYGVKRVRFSIDNSNGVQSTTVMISITLNKHIMCEFQLQIQGQSLQQRRKNLQKSINELNKGFYKDITISRSNFLEGLFKIAEKSLATNFSVKFQGQQGIDAGGLKRQFYDMIGNQMKSENNPFFKATDPKRTFYFFNAQILKNKKKQLYMELFGKYLANSILNSYLIGINFSPVFVKLLYSDPVDFEDLLAILPQQQGKRYKYLTEAPAQDFQDLQIYFTTIIDKKKGIQIDLKQNGANIQVKKQNVVEYLNLLTKVLVQDRFKDLIQAFQKGFQTVIPLNTIRRWIRPHEFWCLTQGTKQLTAEIVLNYVVFYGNADESVKAWFRRYINEASLEILEGFLKFATGSSTIDFDQTSKVTVTFQNAGTNPKKLPISHTCWKEIIVPKYKSYEIMQKLLNAAFIYCSEGFGFG